MVYLLCSQVYGYPLLLIFNLLSYLFFILNYCASLISFRRKVSASDPCA